MKITIEECPEPLQEKIKAFMARHAGNYGGCSVLSVDFRENTPYKDKSVVARAYEVILFTANVFQIYSHTVEPDGKFWTSDDMLTIGTVTRMLDNAPAWARPPHASA